MNPKDTDVSELNELVEETTTETEGITSEDLNESLKIVELENTKHVLRNQIDEIDGAKKELIGALQVADTDNTDFIEEKLKDFTVEELAKKIGDPAELDYFFTDPITGSIIQPNVPFKNDDDKIAFRQEFLLYLKQSQESMAGIDEELKKLDDASKELAHDVNGALAVLSDKLLSQIQTMKTTVDNMAPGVAKGSALKEITAVESGYTYEIYKNTLEMFSGIAKHTWSDFKHEITVIETGKRYRAKLKTAKVKASLIAFAGDDASKSIEVQFLTKDQYQEGKENLFIFSLIRYFAMQDWNDPNTKKAHSSTILFLQKLVRNDIDDSTRELLLTNIVSYLSVLYEKMA